MEPRSALYERKWRLPHIVPLGTHTSVPPPRLQAVVRGFRLSVSRDKRKKTKLLSVNSVSLWSDFLSSLLLSEEDTESIVVIDGQAHGSLEIR
jgi:hypothetical protein